MKCDKCHNDIPLRLWKPHPRTCGGCQWFCTLTQTNCNAPLPLCGHRDNTVRADLDASDCCAYKKRT